MAKIKLLCSKLLCLAKIKFQDVASLDDEVGALESNEEEEEEEKM